MVLPDSLPGQQVSRRIFLKGGACCAAGLAVYSGEFERHDIEVVRKVIRVPGLPSAFHGLTIAQLSDIHLDEYTEPFLLREAIQIIDRLRPEIVLLTGDYISAGVLPKKQTEEIAWKCAGLLSRLECKERYAILGNHDLWIGPNRVMEALTANSIPVLRNACIPVEREGSRIWLSGLDDPVCGQPNPDLAIPESIRNIRKEPVVLMCHAPDYADELLLSAAGQAVSLMLSGHTHGGQVRLPFLGALILPELGKKYVEGTFRIGGMQLYVNRGIGSVALPFRFDCRPEITSITLLSI